MSKKKSPPSDPPEVLELFDLIAELFPGADGFDAVMVRSVATKYANENDFFSGDGAAKCGGRWNRVGLPAIYASLDVVTATEEAYQNFLRYGFPMTAIQPRVTAGAQVTLGKILDLTDARVRRKIGFSLADLVGEKWKAIQTGGEESWTKRSVAGVVRRVLRQSSSHRPSTRTGRILWFSRKSCQKAAKSRSWRLINYPNNRTLLESILHFCR